MRLGLRKLSLPAILATVGAIALLASGCGSSTASGPSDLAAVQTFNQAFFLAGSSDVSTLDPTLCQDTGCNQINSFVYGGLITLDKNLAVEKWDASDYSVSSDGLTYTFHLRDNVKFSNGKAVTMNDYAYAINRAVNPCVASPLASYLFAIKDAATFGSETCSSGVISAADGQTAPVLQTLIGDSIVVVDNKTLKIILAAPAAYFLEVMSFSTFYAIDQTVVGSDITNEKWTDTLTQGSSGQGGDGPYYVSFWDHQTAVKLKPNPNWWGYVKGTKPYLQELDFTFFASSDTEYTAYQAGQYDYAIISPASAVDAARSDPDFHEITQLVETYMIFSKLTPPFDNKDARAAFCLAVNRDQLNTSILKNTTSPTWSVVPKGMPGYDPASAGPDGVTATAGDQAKALTHWQAYVASLGGKPVPAINILYPSGSATRKAFWEAVAAAENQVLGVTVGTTPEAFNSYVKDNTAGNFQVSRFAWAADYPDPQDWTTLLFAGDSTNTNLGGQVSAPGADALMHQADTDTNPTKRLSEYKQATDALLSNAAVCPLYQNKSQYKVRTYVHGYVQDAQTYTPVDTIVNMYNTKH
jgi:peptide/nickel transport system substrate-binding protein/oligopeptide transport system substrate-binding protein